ncbi:MAG: CBS domain-containing protein [Methanosarcinales archaeon]
MEDLATSECEEQIANEIEILEEDWQEALKEMQTYMDITPDDLKRIYSIALKHAKKRIESSKIAKDIMTSPVITVRPDSSIKDVAELLLKNKISGVPVVDEENKVVGIVTEFDLLYKVKVEHPLTFKEMLASFFHIGLTHKEKISKISAKKVGEIMTKPVITVSKTTSIFQISALFTEKNINRVPVVDAENKLIGIVTRADIVKALGGGIS